MALFHFLEDPLRVLVAAHIQGCVAGLAALSAQRRGQGLAGLVLDIGNDHLGPALGAQLRGGTANALRAAGDEDDLVFNVRRSRCHSL